MNTYSRTGVEAYKQKMIELVGKPGFEDKKRDLAARM
ncbi:glucose-6-phosphate isomerase [Staphylococcus felis]|nr:glucose-6-phosphate isomerase [Staphylococcus felis]